MINNKSICLCAIVKNEAKTLPRLVESCKAILDYWVIIDTGSTDDTINVANQALKDIPGDLFKKPWVNFGHNRTELVEIAQEKADYLLLMDADMVVNLAKGYEKINLVADQYMLRYTGSLDWAQPLLVSGTKDWFYEGYTHEFLTSKEPITQGDFKQLTISHLADSGTRGEKFPRDIKLLQHEMIDYPNRTRPLFYLAQSFQNIGDYPNAIETYKKRIQMGGWNEEIYYSLYQIGICLYLSGDKNSAILQFIEAYDARPIRFEALFMLGQIHREMKKYSIAKIFFERMLKQDYPKNDLLFIHKVQYDYLADFELGICNYWLGEYKLAEKHCRKLLNRNDIDPEIKERNKKNFEFVRAKLNLQKNNTNDIVFASMYTYATSYEDESKILKASLDKFKLFHEIMGIRPQGSWVKNTQQKPIIILDVMNRNNKDVVWVDADAEVLEDPVWFKHIDCDLAFHTLQSGEMLTGTVYFAHNEKVKDFLRKWIKLNQENEYPDAFNFQALLSQDKILKVADMPPEYVKIFDLPMGVKEPVIIHNQASRRFKKEVNTGLSPDNLTYTLLKRLKGKKASCAVIGNGPFSNDLSKEIDRAFVMRCNNFKTGEGFEAVGSRVDLNVSSMYHEIIPTTRVDYPLLAVLPLSDTAYQQYTDAKEMHLHWEANAQKCIGMGNSVWTYGDGDDYIKLFKEIAEKINAFPTVGIMAIATARKIGFEKIILSGFTFFDPKEKQSHYWSDIKVIPSTQHNPEAERKLVKEWVMNDPIEYVIDDLMLSKLDPYETVKHNTTE